MPRHSRHLPKNPDVVQTVTLTTYAVSATAADDKVTLASQSMRVGTEVILKLDGGDAQGLVDGATYYVIPDTSTTIKLAATKQDAYTGTAVTIAGDAGAGDIYPFYKARGFLFVGTGGALRVRANVQGEALHKNIANGTLWPWDIGGVHSYADGETIAEDLTVWS